MAAKPPPNRTTDATIFVRCDTSEKAFIEEALATAAAAVRKRERASLPLYAYALGAILEKAEKDLGIKYDDWLKKGGRKT